MTNGSVYKVIELVGTSTESWEAATRDAVKQAAKSIRDIRIVEVINLDAKVIDGDIMIFRSRIKLSFKFSKENEA